MAIFDLGRLFRPVKKLHLLFLLTFSCVCVLFYQGFVARISSARRTFLKDTETQPPSVVIAFLVRNKAHTLPWFLGLIEKFDYPKNRISFWIRSDHNIDNSTAVLEEWLTAVQHEYHSVDVDINHTQKGYSDEKSSNDWSKQRYENVIKLRQQALEDARQILADYIFMADANVIIENNKTLQLLMDQNKIIVGPMFNASDAGYYSNFWEGIDTKGYYVRTEEYLKMVDWEIRGCFPVPILHSALLIDIRRCVTQHIVYTPPLPEYDGPYNDIIIFAHSVKATAISMFILNTRYFGKVMVPLNSHYSLGEEIEQFAYLRTETMVEGPPLYRSKHVYAPPVPQSKLGFDEIFIVHLLRRPERKKIMRNTLYNLGIDFIVFDDIDGKKLNDTYLDSLGVDMLPGFADHYQGQIWRLNMGEIGCFLSHYRIWEEMVSKNHKRIIIFEDDVRFESFFKSKLAKLMKEAKEFVPNWDLMYVDLKSLLYFSISLRQ
ncbi:probable inactive glycosyltransferase 25 family member 3 isoform X2 [Patella vulgata]|uniref:probable inactive glycosyltransferase 25 family member 3 isoform X2 n=1 Tax=Patella vulgata TaxID=6465 RepID=UPI0024A81692|nr:probable inactive glycosyltransferase 25 family member 3 isoform X2 [Patella vulgata]